MPHFHPSCVLNPRADVGRARPAPWPWQAQHICSGINVLRTNLELQTQFSCSCNHGLPTWTDKSCGLVRETTAPWASVPLPSLIPASRAETDQRSYKNHRQTVRPWGYLWIWDSKAGLVVKMDAVNSKWIAEGIPRVWKPGVGVLHQGAELGWGVTALGWGSGMRGRLLCPAPNVDWLWARGISFANLAESLTQSCMLCGEELVKSVTLLLILWFHF